MPRGYIPPYPEEKLHWWSITIICDLSKNSSSLGVQIRNGFVSTTNPNITKKELTEAVRTLEPNGVLLSVSHLGEMSKEEFCEEK